MEALPLALPWAWNAKLTPPRSTRVRVMRKTMRPSTEVKMPIRGPAPTRKFYAYFLHVEIKIRETERYNGFEQTNYYRTLLKRATKRNVGLVQTRLLPNFQPPS